jgi:hypothetical protein
MNDPYNQQPYNPYDTVNEKYANYSEDRRPTFPHHNAAKVTIEQLFFIPTGTYQEQWRRPWTAEVNQGNVNQVYEAVAHAYHDHKIKRDAGSISPDLAYAIDPMSLASVSASFIQPAAVGEAPARHRMKHSLAHQTARFIMTLAVHRHGAVEPNRYLINGYTDHLGLLKKGDRAGYNQSDYEVDHSMEMTVNSIMEVRRMERHTGYGLEVTSEMVSVNQVLLDPNFTGVDQAQIIRLRPYEVATALTRMQDPQINRSGVSTTDTRYVQNGTPTFSDIHHTNPNDYMARTISGLTNGRDMAVHRNQSGLLDPLTNATRELRDQSAANDPFLKAISSFTDGIVSATFKFRDLLMVDPNADKDGICFIDMRDYSKLAGQRGHNMAAGGYTSEWQGRDAATQWAAQIANMLPPMMMDLGVRKIDIVASNIHREKICTAANALPFIRGVNIVPQQRALEGLFLQQFVQPMSFDGQIPYQIDVSVDLYGEIIMNLSVDGSPMYPYAFPAFMSAGMSPILTTQANTLDAIATAFRDLQSQVLPPLRPLITEVARQPLPTGARY